MSPHFETYKNGLRVVYVPCEAESIAFGLFISSGSRHEDAKTAGISHFIEHMLFKGTPTRKPIDITTAIEGRGGNFNACTSEEATIYYAHMPDNYLADAVEILSDMYLHAAFPEDEFKRERDVVLDEIKMYDDDPSSVVMENLQRALFPKNPLGLPVSGTATALQRMTPSDLRCYMRTHYLPTNTIAVVAGHFNEEAAKQIVFRSLGRPRAAKVFFSRAQPINFSAATEKEVSVTRDVNQTQLAVGYRTFGVHDERKYAATVLDAILGRGMSSRLFQEVREKRGLSYDISSRMQFFSDAGMFTISAGLDPSKKKEVLEIINREIKRIQTTKLTATELKRAKEFLIGNFRLGQEKVVSKLFCYGTSMLTFDKLILPQEQIDGINKVTIADIQKVAKAIFTEKNRSISWVNPKNAS
jgi:predicted Zn-dependent peptidase